MGRPKSVIKTVKQKHIDTKTVYKCTCCGKEYTGETAQKRNFPSSQSKLYKANGGRLNVCRNCVDAIFDQYTEVLGEEEAIRRVCMKFDMYYSKVIAKACRKINADRSRIQAYVSKCNLAQYKNRTYDTTLDEEASAAINNAEDLHQNNSYLADIEFEEPITKAVSQDDISIWNYGYTPDEYEWLNAKYDEIRSTNVIDNTTREELVRDYCSQKLLAQKSLIENKLDQYAKISDMAQKTLDRANLTPKIADAADKAGEKPIGVMIQMFEKEAPIPTPRPEWKDVDGIVRLFTIYFLGHLCKMMNIKNRWAQMYEEEMDKYRAEVPEFAGDGDEDIFGRLIEGDIGFHENVSYEGGEANDI